MEQIFVYGTLKEADVQERIIGRRVADTPDVLDGWYKDRVQQSNGTFLIVRRRDGAETHGWVLEVTPEELARMDEYEADPDPALCFYSRVRVTLRSGRETWVYAG